MSGRHRMKVTEALRHPKALLLATVYFLLTEAAAAGSIGLINSVGNPGGFLGPYVLGTVPLRLHGPAPGAGGKSANSRS